MNFSQSEQYTLSIRLSTDGFSFSVSNPFSNTADTLREYRTDESLSLTANLKQCFGQQVCPEGNFRRINVIMTTERYTFVPLEFFEDEQAEILFYHNHPKRENEQVHYNILPKNNIVVLFGMDRSTSALLLERYANVRFYVGVTPFIEYFAAKSRLGNNRKMYTHLRRDSMDVFCFERGHLLLANSFHCQETADRLYYLLYIWKQLGLEQERDELHLTGDLTNKSELLPELRKYIRQVFITNPANNLDLQAITTCE